MSADGYSPAAAVDAANGAYGRHVGRRALHAKGVVCAGYFEPDPRSREISIAAHLQGERIPVVARFSNGSGDPERPDWKTDPRGLGLKFRLPDGASTDIVAVSVPTFPAATPDAFIDLLRAQAKNPLAMVGLIARRPEMLAALLRSAPGTVPPVGFHTIDYHALHAYRLLNAAGEGPWVRYDLRSTEPVKNLSVARASRRGPDYLFQGLQSRLAARPIIFRLEARIAEAHDAIDDPSAIWKGSRMRVTLGTVTVDRVDPSPEENGNVLVFDPTRVTAGIECPNDPVLHFRSPAYSESVARRGG